MAAIQLMSVDEIRATVDGVLKRFVPRLRQLLPNAEFHHIGATAVPGAVTKGDVDVLARVSQEQFPAAVKILKAHFAIKQPENWTACFASFGDDTALEHPLGVQLVVRDCEDDFFLYLRDYLRSNEGALQEYNRFKRAQAVEGMQAYWEAKELFFSKILKQRARQKE